MGIVCVRGHFNMLGVTETDTLFTISDSSALKKQLLIFYPYGSYALLLGCAIGMCYLKNANGIDDEWMLSGNYEINIEGKLYPIKVHLEPPYDPNSERVGM
jgi:hypothetical protein